MTKMTLSYLLLCAGMLLSFLATAQSSFTASERLTVNNINTQILVHGDMWHTMTYDPVCEYPSGAGKHLGIGGSLWMSGYDVTGSLHVAAQTYRQSGNDYWPGPIDATGSIAHAESGKWAKIWKVSRVDIDTFITKATHTIANTPRAILEWPGRLSDYAKGALNVSLTIPDAKAPFVDVDGDGKYEPLEGDYPDIKGDQALWCVYNDDGPTHSETGAPPIRAEVQLMVYGYSRGTAIDNVVYYSYKVKNRSDWDYTNFRVAFWDDGDLGYFLDDYVAFDSARRMGVYYNAILDDGGAAGNPPGSYGLHPPVRGMALLQYPGDGATRVPAGSFMSYNNDASNNGNPTHYGHFNNYMRSQYRDSSRISFGGIERNYMLSGDPNVVGGWSECMLGSVPGDRRFVLSGGDFSLPSGSSVQVVYAFVVTDSGGACPMVDLWPIKELADTARYVYEHPLPTLAVPQEQRMLQVALSPNPAQSSVLLSVPAGFRLDQGASWQIVSMDGVAVAQGLLQSAATNIDVAALPVGVYVVKVQIGGQRTNMLFTKL